jgi:hypothetical protein
MNWIGISTLRFLGLAKDIKVAKIAQPVPMVPDAEPELVGAYD